MYGRLAAVVVGAALAFGCRDGKQAPAAASGSASAAAPAASGLARSGSASAAVSSSAAAPKGARCHPTSEPQVLATLPQAPPQTYEGWPVAPALFVVREEGVLVVSTIIEGGAGGGTLTSVPVDGAPAHTLAIAPTGPPPSEFAYVDHRLWYTEANRLHAVALSGDPQDKVLLEDFGEHLFVAGDWAYAVRLDPKTKTTLAVRAHTKTQVLETLLSRPNRKSPVDAFVAIVADAEQAYVLDSGAREVVAVNLASHESRSLYGDNANFAFPKLLVDNGPELITSNDLRIAKADGSRHVMGCTDDAPADAGRCFFGYVFAYDEATFLTLNTAPYKPGRVGNAWLVRSLPRSGHVVPRDLFEVPGGTRDVDLDADCIYVAHAVDDRKPTRVLAYTRPKD